MGYLLSGYAAHGTCAACLAGDGTLSCPVTLDSPSFIITAKDKIFTLTERTDQAAVHMLQKQNETLVLLDSKAVPGSLLCHLAYSEKHRLLFGACYGSGSVFAAKTTDTGFDFLHNYPQTQDDRLSRAHSVLLNRAQNTLYSANIALDRIYIYDVSDDGLALRCFLTLETGKGPRHLALSADERLLYIITEYSNEVLVYTLPDGSLLQTISTLPRGFAGKANCSTLCFSADRRFLYGANRFADSIAVFAVQADGTLGAPQFFPCFGKTPRHMCISADGAQLAVCNQDSNSVTLLPLNTQTGLPAGEPLVIPFDRPAGITPA